MGSVFPDLRPIAAIVDQITLNACILDTGTQSYRPCTGRTANPPNPGAKFTRRISGAKSLDDTHVNGDEVRNTWFLRQRGLNNGYDAPEVGELLRRVADALDAGQPAGPLIESEKFRRSALGWDIDAADWFLEQLLRREDHERPTDGVLRSQVLLDDSLHGLVRRGLDAASREDPSATGKYCGFQQAGTHFDTADEIAIQWSAGFELGASLGIKDATLKGDFGSTAQTGYDSNALMHFQFKQDGYICGTNHDPSKAGVLVMRSTRQ